MKVLLINGSPNQKGCTNRALEEVTSTLNKEGVETELVWIGKQPIAGCIACRTCKKTNRCVFNNDLVNKLIERLDEFDGIVVGSPVYYSGPNGQICAFLDRLFFAGGDFSGKVGAAVVSCRRGGATASFDRLNKYFTISNMVQASSQYWNMVHGNTPEEVEQDLEGLQTMRTLGQNFARLLKCIEAGKEKGIEKPKYETFSKTNFIR